jgi:hypothetical protein
MGCCTSRQNSGTLSERIASIKVKKFVASIVGARSRILHGTLTTLTEHFGFERDNVEVLSFNLYGVLASLIDMGRRRLQTTTLRRFSVGLMSNDKSALWHDRELEDSQIEKHEIVWSGITICIRFERNWLDMPPSISPRPIFRSKPCSLRASRCRSPKPATNRISSPSSHRSSRWPRRLCLGVDRGRRAGPSMESPASTATAGRPVLGSARNSRLLTSNPDVATMPP